MPETEPVSKSTLFMSIYPRKSVLLAVVLICQVIIIGNGALTLGVDIVSSKAIQNQFSNNLPRLSYLNSLSWRNWKIMEVLAESILLNGTNGAISYQAQTLSHLTAIDFEMSQAYSGPEDNALRESVQNIPLLVSQSMTNSKINDGFDKNMKNVDLLARSAIDKTSNDMTSTLNHVQIESRITLIVNGVILGLVTVLRIAEIFLGPKVSKKDGSVVHVAGAMSMFFLSVLESAAFIIITNTRLGHIISLINKDYPLYTASWQIKYLDPKLTGSAMRFVLSNGDPAWNDFYMQFIDPLTAAYTVTSSTQSPAELAVSNINNAANTILVDLETQSLTNYLDGAIILPGLNYTSNKDIYLYSVDFLLANQEKQLFASLASTNSLCE